MAVVVTVGCTPWAFEPEEELQRGEGSCSGREGGREGMHAMGVRGGGYSQYKTPTRYQYTRKKKHIYYSYAYMRKD